MGFTMHHAIVVTSWNDEAIEEAHNKSSELDCNVSNIIDSEYNSYKSFFVIPDGGKEGWESSNNGDLKRDKLIEYLRDMYKRDKYLDWVEIRYGGDIDRPKITRHSQQERWVK